MQSNFKSLQQLFDFFKDEETCKAYYEKMRWGDKVICPHCNHDKVYRTNRGFKCASKECAKKFSVVTRTIFENAKISLRICFGALFLITTAKKGISSVQLSIQLGITQKSAWFLLHRIREMIKQAETSKPLLDGIIEVDEKYVGMEYKNRRIKDRIKDKENKAKGIKGAQG